MDETGARIGCPLAEKRRTKARKTAHRSGGIYVCQWKLKISERERLKNAKANKKVERQVQIAFNKAQKLPLNTRVQARRKKREYLKSCGSSPPNQETLALFGETDRDFSCRTMIEKSKDREFRWLLDGSSSDIEISFGSQYLDPVASPFDPECEGYQGHLRADDASLAGS
ncbi:hypothetical protein EPUL_005593, partial [Erysiphe pulchra]